MSDDKPKRLCMGPGMYAVDSSGSATERARMRRQADDVMSEVEREFDASRLRRMGRDQPKVSDERAIDAANGRDDLTWWDWLRGAGRGVVEGLKVMGRAVVS